MTSEIHADTLLIIPCCAKKFPDGAVDTPYTDPLRDFVSKEAYERMLGARREALRAIRSEPKFMSDKYLKNSSIVEGAEFGGTNCFGKYLPALGRYAGTLYSVDGLQPAVDATVAAPAHPRVMILSALYGPLHPHTKIQDYNLKMDDVPARVWSDEFSPFLQEYVKRNGIAEISLYLGTKTKYFSVAAKAIAALKAKGLLRRAVQYHVVNGGTRPTPLAHGQRLLGDLGGTVNPKVYDSTEVQENIL
ncbi:MAG: peroxide stress protein YaaA [Halobacteriota archaeon]